MEQKGTLHIFVTQDGALQPEWSDEKNSLNKTGNALQEEIYKRAVSEPGSWLLYLGFCDRKTALSPSVDYFRKVARLFVHKLTRTADLEILRGKAEITLSEDDMETLLESVPPMAGAEYIDGGILRGIWLDLAQTYGDRIRSFDGSVEAFIQSYSPEAHVVGRVFFHMVENKNSDLPFAFMATYSAGLNDHGRSRHLPLKHAITEFEDDQEKMVELLSTVYKASDKSPLVAGLIESGELFHPIAWTSSEAFDFLKEIPLYEESGILCRIPDWWKAISSGAKLGIRMGDSKPSVVGMDALLSFAPEILLGDTKITVKEAREFLEQSQGLAFIKNKWVAVDPEKLRKTIDAYERAQEMLEEGFSIRDALHMQLNPEKEAITRFGESDLSFSRGEWLESVIDKLRHPERVPDVRPGKEFKATLREYQQKGLNWLTFLHTLGFGACLADDMGLGKTVQLLAFLSTLKPGKTAKASLLVIPASLISNWEGEIDRFCPDMKYYVAHPDSQPDKRVIPQKGKQINSLDLVITTYALVQKYEWLSDHSWRYVILDEAQAIKNPGTKQTRAVKSLTCENRITMTGTPVENRLSDLWSLFDFLNSGLLGDKTAFGKFTKELKNNPDGYRRLRTLISPYILRRLKTDKHVINDLPEKVEMKTYSGLSKKQIVLYESMVHELGKIVEGTDGIQRKGVVLSYLMKFKQLCNHPDQFLGTGTYDEKESGKFLRLKELCETISEKRERVLVFTQFKEITGPLCEFLSSIFKRKGLVLHGSVPVGKRKKIIDEFQGDAYVPFMVLSLKAGGVGLNLTKANHVIHFDRWWNPAVENQATDRAFRIGQKKNVVVHKFIARGTIEEKIDRMLDVKKKLSDTVISETGESWITEMSNDELIGLFTLSLTG